jgi:hypothetical protein
VVYACSAYGLLQKPPLRRRDRSIPPLQVENDMIQNDNKKAELFNDYSCKQADLNDSETSVPDITDILINGLEQICITENEVEDILKILDTSKAIGPDLLNPRLLKEAASILKYPLCRLFNLFNHAISAFQHHNITSDK